MGSSEVKVGAFAIGGAVVLAGIITFMGAFSFGKNGYKLYIDYPRVSGLMPGHVVRYAGVNVGTVKDIQVKPGKVAVVVEINDDIKIPQGAIFTIAADGIMGEKFVNVVPPANLGQGFIAEDSTLKGIPGGGMEEFFANSGDLMKRVDNIASAFENSHPLSSNPSKSLPVTGIATIPIIIASSHQVQNVHTSPPRRYAESGIRFTAAMDSGSIFLICIFIVLPPVSDSVAKADKISKCLSADFFDAFHINRIFTCLTRTECNRYIVHMQMMLLINYRHQNIGKKKSVRDLFQHFRQLFRIHQTIRCIRIFYPCPKGQKQYQSQHSCHKKPGKTIFSFFSVTDQ